MRICTKIVWLLLLPALLSGRPGASGALPAELVRTLDSLVRSGLDERAFPGASLVVGDRDGILYERHYGFMDYSKEKPVTGSDLYDVASCTKVLSTTFAVMRLYDEGRLRILDPLGDYLPQYAGTPVGRITLRELLTHTSGLRPQVFYTPLVRNAEGGSLFSSKKSEKYPHEVGKNYYVARSVAFDTCYLSRSPRDGWREAAAGLYVNPAVDTLIRRQILRAYKPERRGAYSYSDTNFLLLMQIAERVAGVPLEQQTAELFGELGCANTGYNPLRNARKQACMPTETDHILCRGTVQGYVHDELGALMGGVGGNAGLFTTASDMARFCEMILRRGELDGRQIVTPKTVDLFTSSPFAAQRVWRGLGFDKREPGSGPLGDTCSFGHTGFTGTIFWMDSRSGAFMVFLSNAVHPTRLNNRLSSSQLRAKLWEAVDTYFRKQAGD